MTSHHDILNTCETAIWAWRWSKRILRVNHICMLKPWFRNRCPCCWGASRSVEARQSKWATYTSHSAGLQQQGRWIESIYKLTLSRCCFFLFHWFFTPEKIGHNHVGFFHQSLALLVTTEHAYQVPPTFWIASIPGNRNVLYGIFLIY